MSEVNASVGRLVAPVPCCICSRSGVDLNEGYSPGPPEHNNTTFFWWCDCGNRAEESRNRQTAVEQWNAANFVLTA